MQHVLLFDIDGTLIDCGGAGSAALRVAFEDAFDQPLAHPFRLHGRTDRGILSEILTSHGLEDSVPNFDKLRSAYLRRLPSHLGNRDGRLLPGVTELLEQLASDSHFHLGLLTGNLSEAAHMKVAHYGLAKYFHFGTYGESAAHRPLLAVEVRRQIETQLGHLPEPTRITVIGDTPLDIECARAIPARVVAVTTGGISAAELKSYEPDLILSDLTNRQLLMEWLKQPAHSVSVDDR